MLVPRPVEESYDVSSLKPISFLAMSQNEIQIWSSGQNGEGCLMAHKGSEVANTLLCNSII